MANEGIGPPEHGRYINHPKLYFHDGDIALAAPASNHDGKSPEIRMLVFRVDKIYLMRHSPVFADMFSASRSNADVNEQYDGVPLVELSDDADDWEALLSVLYDPTMIRLEPFEPDTPVMAYKILRLAKKYDIPNLRASIVAQIEAIWPRTLREYDNFRKEILFRLDNTVSGGDHVPAFRKVPEPASLIRLARDFDIPSVLPAAFYWISTQITPDLPYEDRAVVTQPEDEPQDSKTLRARWSLLDRDDLLHLHIGSHVLQREFMQTLERLIAPACQNETRARIGSSMHCLDTLSTSYAAVIKSRWSPIPDPLSIISDVEEEYETWDICVFCTTSVYRTLDGWRERIWTVLPQTFHLEHTMS